MPRLPIPGGDVGGWGQILNDYLAQAHKTDGTLKDDSVTATALAPNAVTVAALQDGTITEAKLDTTAQAKLNGIASGGVSTVNGRTGAVVLAKADVSLSNVDNTSDANKPVSTATQAALDTKQALGSYASASHTHVAAQISDSTATGRAVLQAVDAAAARTAVGAGTSNLAIGTTGTTAKAGDYTPTKTDVGLSNVDNTSDANKPVSTAVATALSGKASTSHSHIAANISDFSTAADARIAASSVNAFADVTINSPSNGQVLKYNGSAWINDTDNTGGAGSTDLTYSRNATTVTVESSSGLDATIPTADSTNAGVLTSSDKVKLDGVAAGATANASDVTLLNRTNHTGTQAQSTVTNLVSDLVGKASASHTHAATDVTSGVFGIAQIPTGTTVSTVALGNHTHSGFESTVTAGTTAQYYRGDKSWQTLDKTAVGLANIDNTSDANKPVSSATQTALNGKETLLAAGTTSQYYRGDKSWQTLDKTAVGLANVNNTSDTNKPISTATQTALDLKANAVAGSSNVMVYNAYSDAPALPVNTVVVSITGT